MAIQYQQLLSGSQSRVPLLSAPWSVVYSAIVGNQAAILSYFSREVYDAEASQPEGAYMEIEVTGWNIPFVGNVGSRVEAGVNQQWKSGQIRDPFSGEKLEPWQAFPDQIAWYESSSDTLILRWVKGQPWLVWIFAAILVVVGLQSLLNMVGLGSYEYKLFHALGISTSSGTSTTSSSGMPLWEKFLIYGGLGLTVVGAVVFEAELKLREAGANKSNQEIIVER